MYALALIASFFKDLATVSGKQVLIKETPNIYTSELSFVLAIVSLALSFYIKNFHLAKKYFIH